MHLTESQITSILNGTPILTTNIALIISAVLIGVFIAVKKLAKCWEAPIAVTVVLLVISDSIRYTR